MLRTVKKIATPLFIILIVVFFAFYLHDIDYSTFGLLQLSWPLLILASLISLAFRYWGVFIWKTILKDLGAKELPSFTILSNVYSKAWMGRYIPGSVTWIAGKIYMANKLGISKSRLAVSSLLEAGVQIVATLSVSLLLLGFDPRLNVIPTTTKAFMVLVAIGLLVVLYPPILNRLLNIAHHLVKRKAGGDELRTNLRAVTRSYILYVAGTALTGIAYYFLTAALYPDISLASFFYIVGAFNLAGALGMITPFVPSGLGVRDGAQLILLSIIMPKEIALAITIFSRLWSAIIDVAFYLIAHALYRVRKDT